MKLKVLLDELRLGDLSGANLGHNDVEGISTYNYETVVSYINAALLALHTKLPLRVQEVILEQREAITLYRLHPDYAQSNTASTQPIKYLLDTEFPFTGSILRIDEVYNEIGIELPLDNANDPTSLFRPTPSTLKISNPVELAKLSILYRANHPKIMYGAGMLESDFLNQEIELPESYLPSLVSYVVYKHKSSFDTPEAQQSAMSSLAMFEQSISALRLAGLSPEDNTVANKFERNGFV